MHVDAGTIVTLRDEPTPDAPAYAHVGACGACTAALSDATARAALIAEALGALDRPVDLAAAKAATRARLDRTRGRRPAGGWRRWPLGRAAMLLLATAGAASALTWTPIRSMFTARAPATGTTTTSTQVPAMSTAPAQLVERSGIAVDVAGGEIRVIVREAVPGTVLGVVWSDDATARISGPAGSAFTYGDGRLEVDAEDGDLRLELPRTATSTVEVNGRVYVARTPTGVTVSEPAVERTDERVLFLVPSR